MNPSRRRLLFGLAAFAASASPAIARASSLMKVKPPTLILYGDRWHDDTVAMQALFKGQRVWNAARIGGNKWIGGSEHVHLPRGDYLLSDTVEIPNGMHVGVHGSYFEVTDAFPEHGRVIDVKPDASSFFSDCKFNLDRKRTIEAVIRIQSHPAPDYTFDVPRKLRMDRLVLPSTVPAGEVGLPLPAVGERLGEDD